MGLPKGRSGNPAGRPKGIKDKRTKLGEALLIKLINDKSTPLEFLIATMVSPKIPFAYRIDAAKAAAPYVHKRQPIMVETGPDGFNVVHRGGVMIVPATDNLTDWENRSTAAQAALKEEVKK